MPKPLLSVSDSASTGLGPPLYMNGGLIGSMDSIVTLQNLRGAIPGIPIMAAGFPHGFTAGSGGSAADDAKNGLSMLPMMLHGIPHPHGAAAIPQHALFSVGTMMAHAPPPHSTASASASTVTTTTAASEAASPSSTTATADRESGADKEKPAEGAKRPTEAAAAVITSTSRVHHTFNPFLIPGVSHGLLYPHMFLPHGGIMALPAVTPGGADGAPGSPKRRRKRAREEEERERGKLGDAEERESTVTVTASSSASPPSEESRAGRAEPDSINHGEIAAAPEEKEDGSEETGDEVDRRDGEAV